MTRQTFVNKWYIFALLLLALAISAGVFNAKPKPQRQRQTIDDRPRVTSMPPVFSKVRNLEIVRAWIVNPGTAAAGVEVEIKNNSTKDIMAVDLVCGDGAVTLNGLTDEENPIVVIKPHETNTISMNFSEMTFGAPLVVSAVTYADRTEEGEEESLNAMHLGRNHDRAVMKAKKEGEAQKGIVKP